MFKSLVAQIWRRIPSGLRLIFIRVINTRFTVTVGAVIVNEIGEVLVLRHRFRPGSGWGLPGGFLESGEQPIDALRRELREELGLEVDDVEIVWARSFKRPPQVEIIFRAIAVGQIETKSFEVERAEWFAPDHLPEALSTGQKRLIARALDKRLD